MKKLSYLIVLALILGLALAGCTFLSNIGQAPATDQSGLAYLTKEIAYSDLVALWNFDDDNAYDSSGNSNDGTVEGATFFDSTVGMGRALSFDGNDYVYVKYSDTLDITGEITIEAWINPTVVSGYRTIVAKRSGSVANYVLRLWNGKVEFYYRSAGAATWSEWCTAKVLVSAGNPYHIAVTYTFGDDDSIKVYVDDTLYEGSWLYDVADDVMGNIFPVYIGCTSPSSQPFIGMIDEVRIWNFALSQDQLGKIYDFAGFFSPVENPPMGNMVKAGRAIPVKFSLNGDQGLDNIFVPGYPKSIPIKCDGAEAIGEIEDTLTAGGSSLSYDAGQYIYVWKTEKDWAGTCRQLVVKLIDGTSHVANFQFK